MTDRAAPTEARPHLWIGHVVLTVSDPARSGDFWRDLGMREVTRTPGVAVLELRGGTHLVLVPGKPRPSRVPFDLMVEDLDATHALWTGRGLAVSAIEEDRFHRTFTVTDPDGHRVTVNSSHVIGPV